jgi:hypothetical protein
LKSKGLPSQLDARPVACASVCFYFWPLTFGLGPYHMTNSYQAAATELSRQRIALAGVRFLNLEPDTTSIAVPATIPCCRVKVSKARKLYGAQVLEYMLLGALYFGGCCGLWWWAIILGLFASAGLALKSWRDNCQPSTFEIVLTLVVALATVAGTLFGFIQTLGPLTAALTGCAWLWVKVAAGAFAGVLAAWAAANCSGP